MGVHFACKFADPGYVTANFALTSGPGLRG
eukprot:SAG25_NODE_6553_length_551_cov_1.022124_2_plen_29_part_01